LKSILRKILAAILVILAAAILLAYFLWPQTWTVNAPITNSMFGWGISSPEPAEAQARLHLPEAYHLNIYASGLGQARIMRWTSAGDLLVSIPRKGEIVLIARDSGNSGRGGKVRTLLSGLNRPHGIEIADGFLFIGETDAILRVAFDEAAGETRGEPVRIVTGLPGGGNHWSRTVRLGPDGFLYVHVGSSCNACIEDDKRRATLMRVRPDGSGLEIFAEGLRNTVGYDWDSDGVLWGVENGRDLLGDDLPPEELNRIERGKFYGWPFRYGNNAADPEFGKTEDPRAAAAIAPVLYLPAHAAPLSIKFMRGAARPGLEGKTALVALHGSWNRSRKQGYEVIALRWNEFGGIDVQPFLTGFNRAENVSGRPVDITEGPDGALYVSDDYAGVIYRISTDSKAAAALQPEKTLARITDEPIDHEAIARGEALFESKGCTECHGGNPPMVQYKSLSRYSSEEIAAILTTPPANMPAVPLRRQQKLDLAAYLRATYK